MVKDGASHCVWLIDWYGHALVVNQGPGGIHAISLDAPVPLR